MMMKKILTSAFALIGFFAFGQENVELAPDQNPNFQRSLAKYDSIATNYTLKQGTTVQDTYVAIDPLEHKRKMKELRREHRANRPLWRHQRRMERIRNTQFIDYGWNNNVGWGWDNHWGWNRGWNNDWRWRRGRNRGWNNGFWSGTALGLGLGCSTRW